GSGTRTLATATLSSLRNSLCAAPGSTSAVKLWKPLAASGASKLDSNAVAPGASASSAASVNGVTPSAKSRTVVATDGRSPRFVTDHEIVASLAGHPAPNAALICRARFGKCGGCEPGSGNTCTCTSTESVCAPSVTATGKRYVPGSGGAVNPSEKPPVLSVRRVRLASHDSDASTCAPATGGREPLDSHLALPRNPNGATGGTVTSGGSPPIDTIPDAVATRTACVATLFDSSLSVISWFGSTLTITG